MENRIAVIKVNGIEVGSMPFGQYEEIVQSVKKDWRTRIASVFSYAGFIWKFIARLWSYFVQCFSVLFALFMLYSFFHSSELALSIDEFRSLPSKSIADGIISITNICILLTITASFLSYFFKGRPVFISPIENAINKKIRTVMEVPAEGQVSVIIRENGYAVDVR